MSEPILLVCSDLSERSDRAIQRGLKTAKQLNYQCIVLHVVDAQLHPTLKASLLDNAKKLLEGIVGEFRGKAEVRVVEGDPVETIPAVAKEVGAELLVLGNHRTRALFDDIQETTLERIVKYCTVPTLLIRAPVAGDYSAVRALVSFSPSCTAAVKCAISLATHADKIDLVHSVHIPFQGLTGDGPESETAKELLGAAEAQGQIWLAQAGFDEGKVSLSITLKDLNSFLSPAKDGNEVDLLAIGAHTRSNPLAHGLGRFTAGLIRQNGCDLLIAR